jgi:hypothetical protein
MNDNGLPIASAFDFGPFGTCSAILETLGVDRSFILTILALESGIGRYRTNLSMQKEVGIRIPFGAHPTCTRVKTGY